MEGTHQFQLRIARDRLMDLVIYPLSSNYPLSDLPFIAENSVVLYNNPARLFINEIQDNVDYVLYDETNSVMSSSVTRNENQLIIETERLTREDYTFSITATKQETGLSKQLLQTITIKVGVDVAIPIVLETPIIVYNTAINVQLIGTQSGAIYQVFDAFDNELSTKVESGNGGDLVIPTRTLKEDTQLKIKVINKKTKQFGFLNNPPIVSVYPDPSIAVQLQDLEAADYNSVAELLLIAAQKSTYYQLIFKDIDDDSVDKESLFNTPIGTSNKSKKRSANNATASTELEQPIVESSTTTVESSSEATVNGNNDFEDVILKTSKLTEDLVVGVLATKRDSGLTKELVATNVIKVKPNHALKLVIREKVTEIGGKAIVQVQNPQRGIYYQLRSNVDNSDLGWRSYFHKNYGIEKARTEIELAVDKIEDDMVLLLTEPMNEELIVNVFATKATTQVTAQLKQLVTLKLP